MGSLATATLGLVRNLCANDEVKTTICKSSLPCILQVMQHYLNDGKIPESPYKNKKEQAHPASAEEAYAALRDLGLNPNIFKLDEYGNATRSTTEVFGTVQSNFRPVYE